MMVFACLGLNCILIGILTIAVHGKYVATSLLLLSHEAQLPTTCGGITWCVITYITQAQLQQRMMVRRASMDNGTASASLKSTEAYPAAITFTLCPNANYRILSEGRWVQCSSQLSEELAKERAARSAQATVIEKLEAELTAKEMELDPNCNPVPKPNSSHFPHSHLDG